VGSRVLVGRRASETAALRAFEQGSPWRAIHFACHGLVDVERPELSALALSADAENDGFLSCLELARARVRADLVVLSACQTSVGRLYATEGVVGLVRSFLATGAPRVLASLWDVDDAATGVLMERFYDRWNPRDGSAGVPASAALRLAQEHVRSQARWRHARFWAGWTLWGVE
jgi:CHAT domain-containing protein